MSVRSLSIGLSRGGRGRRQQRRQQMLCRNGFQRTLLLTITFAAAEILVAEPRASAGSIPAGKLRREGRTPGVLFSLPGESADVPRLLSFDAKAVASAVQRLGRTGWAVALFDLQIGSETVRALGRQVHQRADTDDIENVTFIACPPERLVRVDVPLRVIGEEVCPGLKAGGKLNWIRRTIPCLARGDAIPSAFELDIRWGLKGWGWVWRVVVVCVSVCLCVWGVGWVGGAGRGTAAHGGASWRRRHN